MNHTSTSQWLGTSLLLLTLDLGSARLATASQLQGQMDHVGVGVRDLAKATQSFTALGFVVVPGGQHPGGTENNAIFFPDGSYVELLAVHDPAKAADLAATIQKREGGLFVGLKVSSAANTAAALKSRGLPVVGPTGGTIKLPTDSGPPPDRWWAVQLGDPAWPYSSFFLLEYEPRFAAQTAESFRAQGGYAHPNSATRVHAVWLATSDFDRTAEALQKVGMPLDAPRPIAPLGAQARIAKLQTGAIVVLRPDAKGATREFVDAVTNGVMGVTIAVTSLDSVLKALKSAPTKLTPYAGLFGRSILLRPDATHGIWLEFTEIP